MKELNASFGVPEYFKHNFISTYFVNTDALVVSRRRRIDILLSLASVLSNFVTYPKTKKESDKLQILVNKCIRDARPVDAISGNLLRLFNIISQVKELLLDGLQSVEDVDTYIDLGIDRHPINHEGFVMSNQFGTFKLVKRPEFSFYNFTLPKHW